MTPSRSLRVEAPAKINLGLRVVGRRSDGYHELDSIFAPLDLCDAVELSVEEIDADSRVDVEVEGRAAGVPADASNLAARAALDFAELAGLRLAIGLRVVKRIPTGAGLGGGSSDAGAVFRALGSLFPTRVSPEALSAAALGLGADVPFFLDPQPARVRGIGERIEPLAGLPALALLLLNPGIELATASVFQAADALTPGGRDPRIPPPSAPRWRFGGLESLDLSNDLEAAAVRLCPPVARLRERLRQLGAVAIGMSGSGPTLFGVFASVSEARNALDGAQFGDTRSDRSIWARVAATTESR